LAVTQPSESCAPSERVKPFKQTLIPPAAPVRRFGSVLAMRFRTQVQTRVRYISMRRSTVRMSAFQPTRLPAGSVRKGSFWVIACAIQRTRAGVKSTSESFWQVFGCRRRYSMVSAQMQVVRRLSSCRPQVDDVGQTKKARRWARLRYRLSSAMAPCPSIALPAKRSCGRRLIALVSGLEIVNHLIELGGAWVRHPL
jgi:hypothetical protein